MFIDNADTIRKFKVLTDATGIYQIQISTASVEFNTSDLPARFELAQNYPNPFASSTAIPYRLNKRADVQITIFDLLGREVRKFVVGTQTAGSHHIRWDGRDNAGNNVVNGIYFGRLQTEAEFQVIKMILHAGSTGSISLSQIVPSMVSEVLDPGFHGGNYSVRIENAEDTSPFIIPYHLRAYLRWRFGGLSFSRTKR